MKIKPTTQRGRIVLAMNSRDEQLLAGGSSRKENEATLFKLKNLLVPIDFSDCSRKALDYALPFALTFGGTVTLLHALHVNYYPTSSDYAVFDYPELMVELRQYGEEKLHLLADAVRKTCPVKTIIETGHPGDIIVTAAKKLGMDLIIISTHGRTGLKRAFLGSTAEYVVRHAPCPVLVVREREKELVRHVVRRKEHQFSL